MISSKKGADDIHQQRFGPTISLTISKSTPKLRGGRTTVVGGGGSNGGCSMFAACIRKSDGTRKIVAADTKLGGEGSLEIGSRMSDFTYYACSNRWGVGRRLVRFASSETRKSINFFMPAVAP